MPLDESRINHDLVAFLKLNRKRYVKVKSSYARCWGFSFGIATPKNGIFLCASQIKLYCLSASQNRRAPVELDRVLYY